MVIVTWVGYVHLKTAWASSKALVIVSGGRRRAALELYWSSLWQDDQGACHLQDWAVSYCAIRFEIDSSHSYLSTFTLSSPRCRTHRLLVLFPSFSIPKRLGREGPASGLEGVSFTDRKCPTSKVTQREPILIPRGTQRTGNSTSFPGERASRGSLRPPVNPEMPFEVGCQSSRSVWVDVAGGIVPTQSNIRSRLARAGCATPVEGFVSQEWARKAQRKLTREVGSLLKSDGMKDTKRAAVWKTSKERRTGKDGERQKPTFISQSTYLVISNLRAVSVGVVVCNPRRCPSWYSPFYCIGT